MKRVGVTAANLSILKTGKARGVRFSTLEKLCEVLDCQPADLLEYLPDQKTINLSHFPAPAAHRKTNLPERVFPTTILSVPQLSPRPGPASRTGFFLYIRKMVEEKRGIPVIRLVYQNGENPDSGADEPKG